MTTLEEVLYTTKCISADLWVGLHQSCGLLAEDWPQSFEQYTQNGQYFRQNVMIWLFKKYFGLFRLHSYLSAAPSVKQGHVFFIYSRPYLRLGAHNSDETRRTHWYAEKPSGAFRWVFILESQIIFWHYTHLKIFCISITSH